MSNERGTLEDVINARNSAVPMLKRAAADPSDPEAIKALAGAEATLGGTLGRLFALAESVGKRIFMRHHRCYSCFAFGSSCSELG